jgi:hypothetical protein
VLGVGQVAASAGSVIYGTAAISGLGFRDRRRRHPYHPPPVRGHDHPPEHRRDAQAVRSRPVTDQPIPPGEIAEPIGWVVTDPAGNVVDSGPVSEAQAVAWVGEMIAEASRNEGEQQ